MKRSLLTTQFHKAARFRLYAYSADGEVLGEINSSNGYDLSWTVDVANTKAAATIFKCDNFHVLPGARINLTS